MSRLVVMHAHSFEGFTADDGKKVEAGEQVWAFDPDDRASEGPMPFKLTREQQRVLRHCSPGAVFEVEYDQVVRRGKPALELVQARRVGVWRPGAGIEEGSLAVAK